MSGSAHPVEAVLIEIVDEDLAVSGRGRLDVDVGAARIHPPKPGQSVEDLALGPGALHHLAAGPVADAELVAALVHRGELALDGGPGPVRAAHVDLILRLLGWRGGVFGPAARGTDFNPETSDADFLIEFEMSEMGAIRNPYLLASIERDRETVPVAPA